MKFRNTQLSDSELSRHVILTLKDDELYTHSAYFQGSYQRKTALYFLRIVFEVVKQRAMAYFAERHDALGFLEKILYDFKSYLYFS